MPGSRRLRGKRSRGEWKQAAAIHLLANTRAQAARTTRSRHRPAGGVRAAVSSAIAAFGFSFCCEGPGGTVRANAQISSRTSAEIGRLAGRSITLLVRTRLRVCWGSRNRQASPQYHPLPSWPSPSTSWNEVLPPWPWPSHGLLSCSPERGSPWHLCRSFTAKRGVAENTLR